MFKVWMIVMFLHTPDMPSVKYQAAIFKTENECMEEVVSFLNYYESKPYEYKKNVKADAHCLEFESFPITRLMSNV